MKSQLLSKVENESTIFDWKLVISRVEGQQIPY